MIPQLIILIHFRGGDMAQFVCNEGGLGEWIRALVLETFRYSNVFIYNPLYRNSVIRIIIRESGENGISNFALILMQDSGSNV